MFPIFNIKWNVEWNLDFGCRVCPSNSIQGASILSFSSVVSSWYLPWIWTLIVRFVIHTFIIYPFRIHGVLGQQVQGIIKNAEGRGNNVETMNVEIR